MYFLVGFLDVSMEAHVIADFFHGRIIDIPDLRVSRREVPLVAARIAPCVNALRHTSHPGLARVVMDSSIFCYIVISSGNVNIPKPFLDF